MHPAKQKSIARQEEILLSLKKLDYLTRSQVQKLHDLKGVRNANRILKEMETYLNSFYDGQKVYYLNKDGRELVGSNVVRNKITTTKHYLMRNDLYIYLGRPPTWKNEIRMKYESSKNKIILVADAHFTTNRHHLVEIDNTQKMHKNKIKIEKYRRLIEKGAFKGMPEIIWVTTTTYRQHALRELCDGLDVKVYLREDLI